MNYSIILIILLQIISSCSTQSLENMKNPDSTLFKNKVLDFVPERPEKCLLKDGDGYVFLFESEKRTHLFRTEGRFVEELLIETPYLPHAPVVISLDESNIKACYKSGQQALMFLDFHPTGAIIFEVINKSKLEGFVKLNVVNELENNDKREIYFKFKIRID